MLKSSYSRKSKWSVKYRIGLYLLVSCTFIFVFSLNAYAVSRKKKIESFGKAISQMTRNNPPQRVNGVQSTNPYATKRLIVKVKKGRVNWKKYSVKEVIEGFDGISILQFRTISDTKKAERKIRKLKNIVYVEPDRLVGTTSVGKKQNNSAPNCWGADITGLADFSRYVSTVTSKSIKVAIIDTGVANHPFLKSRLTKGKNVYLWGKSTQDLAGHGTHIAGIVVDSTPELNVMIMPIQVGEDMELIETDIGIGILYAVELGAKVLNLSLAYKGQMKFVEDMINEAIKKGCIVIVSSGNDHLDVNKKKVSPAYLNNVITVGAVDRAKHVAEFSNYGRSLDVVAPGVAIESTWIDGSSNYLEDGTSMAAPYVSALAAMYCLLYPDKTPAQIKNLITENALDLGKKGWDKYYGHGLIQAPTIYTKLSLEDTAVDLAIGEKRTLKYSLKNRYLKNGKVIWKSSNPSIASVNNGVVTGMTTGEAIVSVSAFGKTVNCSVSVKGYTLREKAIRVYKEALKEGTALYGNAQFTAYFSMIDLDANGIPELLVADAARNCNSVTVYGVNGNLLNVYDLYDVSTENHSINSWYYPGTGILFTTNRDNVTNPGDRTVSDVKSVVNYQYAYLGKGAENIIGYPLFSLLKSEWTYKNGEMKTIYLRQGTAANNEMIQKESFENILRGYIGNAKAVPIQFYENNLVNRGAILS